MLESQHLQLKRRWTFTFCCCCCCCSIFYDQKLHGINPFHSWKSSQPSHYSILRQYQIYRNLFGNIVETMWKHVQPIVCHTHCHIAKTTTKDDTVRLESYITSVYMNCSFFLSLIFRPPPIFITKTAVEISFQFCRKNTVIDLIWENVYQVYDWSKPTFHLSWVYIAWTAHLFGGVCKSLLLRNQRYSLINPHLYFFPFP